MENEKGRSLSGHRLQIESLIDAVYGGAKWNPGKEKRVNVPRKRANVLDINVCEEPGCECGWNIQIGSQDYKLLSQILDLINS